MEHNRDYFNNQSTYFLDVNEYADLSNDEFTSRFTGLNRNAINWKEHLALAESISDD